MFDHQYPEPLVVSDRYDAENHLVRKRRDPEDVIQALLPFMGASEGWLVEFDRPNWRDKLLPHRSLSEDFEGELNRHLVDMRPIWFSEQAHIMCVPFIVQETPIACLILRYSLDLLPVEKAALERQAFAAALLVKSHLHMKHQLANASRQLEGAMGFLDNSCVGTILFDNQGHMILANRAARDKLDAQDGMRMGARGPVPIALKDASRFQLALEHQIAENACGLKNPRKGTVLLIRRQEGKRPFVVTMIPAPKPAVRAGEPAVLFYLFDPSDAGLDHLDAICELYGLSRVESRLAHHIALGKTIDEAAVAMRIKVPTARTYLKHIFMKTGTHRQTDLVRLLMLSTGRISAQATAEALT